MKKILEETRDKDINFSQKCKTKKQPYHVINEAKQLTKHNPFHGKFRGKKNCTETEPFIKQFKTLFILAMN